MGHIELQMGYILLSPPQPQTPLLSLLTVGRWLLTTLYLVTTANLYCSCHESTNESGSNKAQHRYFKRHGVTFIGPASGEQACGDVGSGRMVEPVDIANVINDAERDALSLSSSLKALSGKNITITAGPTREPLDPVRYISNHSSGKMGFAIAQAAALAGANVLW